MDLAVGLVIDAKRSAVAGIERSDLKSSMAAGCLDDVRVQGDFERAHELALRADAFLQGLTERQLREAGRLEVSLELVDLGGPRLVELPLNGHGLVGESGKAMGQWCHGRRGASPSRDDQRGE